MGIKFTQWAFIRFRRIVNSIAFYPAIIAILFLGLSFLMIHIDFSETGKQIKSGANWLRLKDASTARSIISVIAAGILSLTVFSFTMVMVILNQAASQMSNRVLDKLIGNRFQQIVLGCYIGTIVYSLFLLSAIRDIDSGIYVPALSTYLLIALAIIDIFLFIYFLHYITQSIKYSVIINRIHKQTFEALKSSCRLSEEPEIQNQEKGLPITANKAGIYEGFNKEALMDIAVKENYVFTFLHKPGSFLLKEAPVLMIKSKEKLTKEKAQSILEHIFINKEESIENNFHYGFRQLTEVAVKALSPGINDPGTAVESLRALMDLLSYRIKHFPDNYITDDNNITRIITSEPSFEEIFESAIFPIWDYGKNDRMIQHELLRLLRQFQLQENHPTLRKLQATVNAQINKHENILD